MLFSELSEGTTSWVERIERGGGRVLGGRRVTRVEPPGTAAAVTGPGGVSGGGGGRGAVFVSTRAGEVGLRSRVL